MITLIRNIASLYGLAHQLDVHDKYGKRRKKHKNEIYGNRIGDTAALTASRLRENPQFSCSIADL